MTNTYNRSLFFAPKLREPPYDRLKAIEAAAVRETKAARRKGQRQRLHAAAARPLLPDADTGCVPPELDDTEEIEPFDDLEELNE